MQSSFTVTPKCLTPLCWWCSSPCFQLGFPKQAASSKTLQSALHQQRVSGEIQKTMLENPNSAKFLLCNNSSSFSGHCCSYRALLLLTPRIHHPSLAQPGTQPSGIQLGNKTPSAKEKTQEVLSCAAHNERQKNLTASKKYKSQITENKVEIKTMLAEIATGNDSITKWKKNVDLDTKKAWNNSQNVCILILFHPKILRRLSISFYKNLLLSWSKALNMRE